MATGRIRRDSAAASRSHGAAPVSAASLRSGIRDNHSRGPVADFLRTYVTDSCQMSVVSAFFTIYAYDALRQHLNRIGHMDFLFGEPRFIRSLDPDKTEKKAFIISVDGMKLANSLQQRG